LKLLSTRFDGSMHRIWSGVLPTPEPWCFFIPPHSPVHERNGSEWDSPYPVIGMFWPDKHYQVFMLLKECGTTYYCNVISPAIYDAGQQTVRFIDLDLDLVLDHQGVHTLDEKEFAQRQAAYPRAMVDAALAAIQALRDFALDRRGPFALATECRWRVFAQNL
jgi:uncharacterized protein